jgi:hypothetical protein
VTAPLIEELCPRCRQVWRAHQRLYYAAQKARRGGQVIRRVSPDRTAAHIDALRDVRGMTLQEIADKAGVARITLKRTLHAAKHRTGERVWSVVERSVLDIPL